MDLCLAEDRRLGSRVIKRWWEKDRFDVEGTWKVALEEERTEKEEEKYGTETETD